MRKFREMIFSGGNKGFTLIELLVVIAVLGILAGIAVPRMFGITDRAKVSAVEADLRNIQTGLEMYFAEKTEYPVNVSTLGDLSGQLNDYIEVNSALQNIYDYSDATSSTSITVNTTNYSINVNVGDDPLSISSN